VTGWIDVIGCHAIEACWDVLFGARRVNLSISAGRLAGPQCERRSHRLTSALADARSRVRWALMAALSVSLASLPARAAFDAADTGWEGCSQLVELAREELGSRRVRVITSLDYSVLEPRDAIMFLHPEVEIRFHPLAAFLAAGGRAAVVDDHGKAAALLERFHIHRANAPALPEFRVGQNSQLPIALPASSESNEPNDHPTLRGVDQVVTNHPTALRLEAGIELTPLLVLPARGEADALLAVTGVIGDARACGLASVPNRDEPPEGHCGRLLAMGDPSAFINLMMRYPGNTSFARGVFNYLLEDDTWGRRGGNLYVLSGEFKQTGTYGDPSGLRETLSEQQAAFLDWLEEVQNNGLPEPLSIALAAVAAICVAIWTGLAGGQLYSPLAPGYARPLPHAAQGGFAGRVAVLASKSTDRALILRELKRTLESSLRVRMGLPATTGPHELVKLAGERALLSPTSSRALERLLTRLSAGEIAVMSARRLSISDRKLEALHDGVLEILTEMVELENPKRDSRSQHG
jgi:hypothetical protein